MTPPRPHLEPEEVAAFLDGGLGGAERTALEAHLADCADCRELLEESAHALAALDPLAASPAPVVAAAARPPGTALPARRRRPRPLAVRLALPLAAVLLLALLAPWLVGPLRTPPPRVGLLAEQLPPARELTADLWQRGVYRGPGAGAGRLDRRSTLAGVLLLDARVALAAGDRERAITVTSRLAALAEEIGQLESAAERLREVAERLERGGAPEGSVAAVDEVEPELEQRLLPGWLDLGRLVEAGRLAAARRAPDFFRARSTRVRLERLRAPGAGLDGATLEALAELAVFCDSPPAADPEWAALAAGLDDLLIRTTP